MAITDGIAGAAARGRGDRKAQQEGEPEATRYRNLSRRRAVADYKAEADREPCPSPLSHGHDTVATGLGYRGRVRDTCRLLAAAALLTLVSPAAYAAESPPDFSEDYWKGEVKSADGKITRGAGLIVLGVATVVPAAILFGRSTANPDKFLAWSLVTGVAAVSMIGHGIGSVGFGKKQKAQAEGFSKGHRDDTDSVDPQQELDAFVSDQRVSATKLVLFGSVLSSQGFGLLTSAIVLSVKRHRGRKIGGANLWPSYLVGGLLLAGGVAIIIANSRQYGELRALESQALNVGGNFTIAPNYRVDTRTGARHFGVSGRLAF
jgi:hypothetical protein